MSLQGSHHFIRKYRAYLIAFHYVIISENFEPVNFLSSMSVFGVLAFGKIAKVFKFF